jgi:hypothetical protein
VPSPGRAWSSSRRLSLGPTTPHNSSA